MQRFSNAVARSNCRCWRWRRIPGRSSGWTRSMQPLADQGGRLVIEQPVPGIVDPPDGAVWAAHHEQLLRAVEPVIALGFDRPAAGDVLGDGQQAGDLAAGITDHRHGGPHVDRGWRLSAAGAIPAAAGILASGPAGAGRAGCPDRSGTAGRCDRGSPPAAQPNIASAALFQPRTRPSRSSTATASGDASSSVASVSSPSSEKNDGVVCSAVTRPTGRAPVFRLIGCDPAGFSRRPR